MAVPQNKNTTNYHAMLSSQITHPILIQTWRNWPSGYIVSLKTVFSPLQKKEDKIVIRNHWEQWKTMLKAKRDMTAATGYFGQIFAAMNFTVYT